VLLKDVGTLQEGFARGKLHGRFVAQGCLFGDNILLQDEPHPKTFQRKVFCRKA